LIIYSCSGASNVGQLANEVAVEMSRAGHGSMGCLVGLSAHVPIMVQNAKAANRLLVIDGCGVRCGKKALEHVGLSNYDSVVLTDLEVKKTYDLKGDRDIVPELIKQISERTRAFRPIAIGEGRAEGGGGCGRNADVPGRGGKEVVG
jgi:uncharacterized metal-binding protein